MRFQIFVALLCLLAWDHLMLAGKATLAAKLAGIDAAYDACQRDLQACYSVCGAYQTYSRDGLYTFTNSTCFRPCSNIAVAKCAGLPDFIVGRL